MSSAVASASMLVCRSCRAAFFAEYGYGGGVFCSEGCELRPVAMPDDDDGYDGLDYEAGDTHCVLARPGCDPDVLPEAWRAEGAAAIHKLTVERHGRFAPSWCVCGSAHTVLSRAEVRQLRAAGYVVQVNNDDCGDYDYRDDRDDIYDRHCRSRWCEDDRSPHAYLQGEFDIDDDEFDTSLHTMEYEWLTAMLWEEGEALERLGFSLPSGVREFLPVEPPPPTAPREESATRVGPFAVGVRGGAYIVEHAHGGLVPGRDGGFAGVVSFDSRGEAVAHAESCWAALLRGDPNPFRRTMGTAPGRQDRH